MGALPDREPLVGAQPLKSPDQAPPLFAVPPRAAPEPVAPPEPGPEPDRQERAAPEPGRDQPGAPEQETEDDQDQEQAGERLKAWFQGQMEGLDVWSKPIPPLSRVWEKALQGDHLPASPVWRVGEIARLVVSLPLSALAYLLSWALVSAPRSAGLCVAVVAVWMVASTLVSALVDLL